MATGQDRLAAMFGCLEKCPAYLAVNERDQQTTQLETVQSLYSLPSVGDFASPKKIKGDQQVEAFLLAGQKTALKRDSCFNPASFT